MNWSKLEANVEDAIWSFLNLTIDDGRVITSRLNADLKLSLLRALARTYLPKDMLNEVTPTFEFIAGYQEDRNFIVHGQWGTLMPDNVPVCASLRLKSLPGEVTVETFSEERMLNIINGILEAITALKILMEYLEAPRKRFEV